MLTKKESYAISLIEGIGNKSLLNLIDSKINLPDFTSESLNQLIKGSKKKDAIFQLLKNFEFYYSKAESIIRQLEAQEINLIYLDDINYPKYFLNIDNKPIFIFAKGNLRLLNHDKNIAIVGTRKCSSFGKNIAIKTAEYFASKGFNIVSGLALGIDTAAHTGALNVNGYTTAVLVDIDNILPESNKELANTILENNGLLISENPPGTFPQGGLFVARDRLQSGLSEAVFPIETDIEGGTMHTVRFAEAQERLLFCPDLDSIDNYPSNFKKSSGIKMLLVKNKARKYNKDQYLEIEDKIYQHRDFLNNSKFAKDIFS